MGVDVEGRGGGEQWAQDGVAVRVRPCILINDLNFLNYFNYLGVIYPV